MASTKTSTASAVRAWLLETKPEGVTVGKRGLLPPEGVKAFNSAHPRAKYVVGTKVEKTMTVPVAGTDKRGRKTTRQKTVTLAEARVVLGAEGKRGRISKSALSEALSAQASK